MDMRIEPGVLRGRVQVPASKSAAHRALICAALADGVTALAPFEPIKDMLVTMEAVGELGVDTALEGEVLTVRGGVKKKDHADIDCVESGSTFRFMLPLMGALGIQTHFYGSGRLPQRPITDLSYVLAKNGAVISSIKKVMLTISGQLKAGEYTLAGNVSSQYVTGLLFALPLLDGDSEIVLTSPLESRGYVDMTIEALEQFGIRVQDTGSGYRVPGGQQYRVPGAGGVFQYTIEGDYSGAAFWLCANALGSRIDVAGLRADSKQGDRAIVRILERMAKEPTARDIDVSQIPDLMPALSAAAAFADGVTTISGAARLRLKESDRIQTVTEGLRALGADVEEHEAHVVIKGGKTLPGDCEVDSHGDHRIAMAMSIAALRCHKPVIIRGAQCVEKSYPDFYKHFEALGGSCHVV